MNSSFLKLNWKDAAKGAFYAALTIIAGFAYNALSSNPPHFPSWAEWVDTFRFAGASAGLYIVKQILSNSDGQPLKKEQAPQAIFKARA